VNIHDRVREAMRELDRQKNDLVESFLVSGAMIRDLHGEVGSPDWIEVEPNVWQLQQKFRIL
jgi:hypothetical protein